MSSVDFQDLVIQKSKSPDGWRLSRLFLLSTLKRVSTLHFWNQFNSGNAQNVHRMPWLYFMWWLDLILLSGMTCIWWLLLRKMDNPNSIFWTFFGPMMVLQESHPWSFESLSTSIVSPVTLFSLSEEGTLLRRQTISHEIRFTKRTRSTITQLSEQKCCHSFQGAIPFYASKRQFCYCCIYDWLTWYTWEADEFQGRGPWRSLDMKV